MTSTGSRAGFGVVVSANSNSVNRAFANTNREIGRFNRTIATTTNQRLAAFSSRATQTGRTLTRNLTLPLLAIGAAAARVAVQFDEAFTRIGTLTGQSQADIQGYRDELAGLSREVATSQTELAEALLIATSAGFRNAEALDLTRTAAQLAAIGAGDLSSVTRALTAVLENYADTGITAAEAGQVFLGSIQQGNFEASQFANVFARFLPQAAALGVEINQVGAEFAILTRATTDGALASTQYSAALAAIIKPSIEARTALDTAGVSVEELRQLVNEQGLSGALERLVPALSAAGLELSNVFVDRQALNGVLTLNKNLAVTPGVLQGIESSAANVEAQFANAAKTVRQELNQALVNFNNVLMAVGQATLPSISRGLNALSGYAQTAADRFINLTDQQQDFALQLALIGSSLGGVAFAFGGITRRVLQTRVAYDALASAKRTAINQLAQETLLYNRAASNLRTQEVELGRARRTQTDVADALDRRNAATADLNRSQANLNDLNRTGSRNVTGFTRAMTALNVVAAAAAAGGLLFLARGLNDVADATIRASDVTNALTSSFAQFGLPTLVSELEGETAVDALERNLDNQENQRQRLLQAQLEEREFLDTFQEAGISTADILSRASSLGDEDLRENELSDFVGQEITRINNERELLDDLADRESQRGFLGSVGAGALALPGIGGVLGGLAYVATNAGDIASAGFNALETAFQTGADALTEQGLVLSDIAPEIQEQIDLLSTFEFGSDAYNEQIQLIQNLTNTIEGSVQAETDARNRNLEAYREYRDQVIGFAEDQGISYEQIADDLDDINEGTNLERAIKNVVRFAEANGYLAGETRQSSRAVGSLFDELERLQQLTTATTGVAPSLREQLGLDDDILEVEEAIQQLETSGVEAEIRARFNSIVTDPDDPNIDQYNQATIDSLQDYFGDVDTLATLFGEQQDIGAIDDLLGRERDRFAGLEDVLPPSVFRQLTDRFDAIGESARAVARGEDVSGGFSIADGIDAQRADVLAAFENVFGDVEAYAEANPLILNSDIDIQEAIRRMMELLSGDPITIEVGTTFTDGFRPADRGGTDGRLTEFTRIYRSNEAALAATEGGFAAGERFRQAFNDGLTVGVNPERDVYRLGVPELLAFINRTIAEDFDPNLGVPFEEEVERLTEQWVQDVRVLSDAGTVEVTPELNNILFQGNFDELVIDNNNGRSVIVIVEADTSPARSEIQRFLDDINAQFDPNNTGLAAADLGLFGAGPFPIPANRYQTGGIVDRPTLGVVGEGGEPEAIIPLSRAEEFGFGGNNQPATVNNIYIQGDFYGDEEAFADRIDELSRRREQING